MLKRIGSDRVGVCLDTGNSIALLEDPMEVVEALAPWAFTTHFKDMGVQEYERGFLLSEVPLGEGFLDLPRIVRVLRRARPEIRFNLEMITRDPLEVPCLTPKYWATFEDLPGRHLARSLTMVRDHPPKRALPRVAGLSREEQLKAEEDNVRRCLAQRAASLGRERSRRPTAPSDVSTEAIAEGAWEHAPPSTELSKPCLTQSKDRRPRAPRRRATERRGSPSNGTDEARCSLSVAARSSVPWPRLLINPDRSLRCAELHPSQLVAARSWPKSAPLNSAEPSSLINHSRHTSYRTRPSRTRPSRTCPPPCDGPRGNASGSRGR